MCFVTVQNRIFFTYLYLDNTTGMTHLKTIYVHLHILFRICLLYIYIYTYTNKIILWTGQSEIWEYFLQGVLKCGFVRRRVDIFVEMRWMTAQATQCPDSCYKNTVCSSCVPSIIYVSSSCPETPFILHPVNILVQKQTLKIKFHKNKILHILYTYKVVFQPEGSLLTEGIWGRTIEMIFACNSRVWKITYNDMVHTL